MRISGLAGSGVRVSLEPPWSVNARARAAADVDAALPRSARNRPVTGARRKAPLARTVLHVTYPDLAARLELITGRLGRLTSRQPLRQLFFADVPIADATGLEIVQLHERDDRPVLAELDEWRTSCCADGLIRTATPARASLVLDRRLFLGGRVPASYIAQMVIHSARAAEVLGRLGRPASEAEVARELAALYLRLLPGIRERQHALEWHAIWLERTANGTNHPGRQTIAVDPKSVRASTIARLAHTQAVRLRGPAYDD